MVDYGEGNKQMMQVNHQPFLITSDQFTGVSWGKPILHSVWGHLQDSLDVVLRAQFKHLRGKVQTQRKKSLTDSSSFVAKDTLEV